MATMVKLLLQMPSIVDETYKRINEAELMRSVEYRSIVRIQAWYRAVSVRCYLKHLNKCAVTIQRRWRGYLGRKKYRAWLQNALFEMKLRHFTQHAVKIQKTWRGFYTRKYVANYYSRRRYLEAVKVKNEVVRRELEAFSSQQNEDRQQSRDVRQERKLNSFLQLNHHLLSTTSIPGIYNSPYQPYPLLIESRLRDAKPDIRKNKSKLLVPVIFDPNSQRYDLPKPTVLPPVNAKPQGPFRLPETVQASRYEPFHPSLRVMTDYFSLEKARKQYQSDEWVKKLSDTVFQPFSRRSVPYEPYLHPTSAYGELPYGSKHFREEFPDKFLTNKDFKTIVPPVPLFDRLNQTFSSGQV